MAKAFALYIRQCLSRMEKLIDSAKEGSDAVNYAKILMEDLKNQYQNALIKNLECATKKEDYDQLFAIPKSSENNPYHCSEKCPSNFQTE